MTTILQFSGGKDSLACLYLCREQWDEITVAWVNTGDAFPETVEFMRRIASMVPHFVEIRSDQPANIRQFGWPADIIPVTRTPYGRMVDGHSEQDIQPSMSCCAANIWAPMLSAIKELGATRVIRGTKESDKRKATIQPGDVVEGIEYVMPVWDWSDDQVMAYLRDVGAEVPGHYPEVNTSLDCRHCTAYLYENAAKFRYMRERMPELHAEVSGRVREIRAVVLAEADHMRNALGE